MVKDLTVEHKVKDVDSTATGASASVNPLFNEHAPKVRTETMGKKAHWFMTYAGVDWLLNSTVGVAFAFLTARTEIGQRFFGRPVEKGFSAVLKPVIKNEQVLEKAVNGGKDFLSIMVGGTVINPIITKFESHDTKKKITKSFDKLFYGSRMVENDPYFERAYQEIDNEPVKDTKGVWISRGMAIAPLWAATFSPRIMKFFESNNIPGLRLINFDHVSSFSKKLAGSVGIKPGKFMQQTQLNKTTGEVTSNWDALHRYIGFDFGLTIFYAVLHAVSFGLVAKKLEIRKENHELRKEMHSKSITVPAADGIVREGKDEAADLPQATVGAITHESRIANPELGREA